MKRRLRNQIALTLTGIALAVSVSPSAFSYYSFVRSSQRTTWPVSVFTFDHSGTTAFQGSTNLSMLSTAGAIPNNDNLGLLLVADSQHTPNLAAMQTCNAAGLFGASSGMDANYQAVFNALATWDSVASTVVNFAFVCSLGDIGAASFDNNPPVGATDLDIWQNGDHVFNGVNEIAFDDTAGASLIAALNLGLDPSVLLGLSLPFDTNNRLIVDTVANGTIAEGFIIINVSDQLAPNTIDLQGIITHELGHFLGLAHTGSILNIASSTFTLTPTMYFAALPDVGVTTQETRTLEADDIAGITASYPASGEPLASFGSISGSVRTETGAFARGAGIIARNTTTNAEIGIIVGGIPGLSADQYRIDGVPPGDYNVRMVALDGSSSVAFANTSSTGNIDSIFSTPALEFDPIFFDEATSLSGATTVPVTLGQDTPDIDFGGQSGGDDSGLFGSLLSDPDGCRTSSAPGSGISLSFLIALAWPFLSRRLSNKKEA